MQIQQDAFEDGVWASDVLATTNNFTYDVHIPKNIQPGAYVSLSPAEYAIVTEPSYSCFAMRTLVCPNELMHSERKLTHLHSPPRRQ